MKLIRIFHQSQSSQQKNGTFQGISSFTLHIIAMLLMLCDHLWATVFSRYAWLTWVGRLAYPIFAFMLVEGYFHTRQFEKVYGTAALLGNPLRTALQSDVRRQPDLSLPSKCTLDIPVGTFVYYRH